MWIVIEGEVIVSLNICLCALFNETFFPQIVSLLAFLQRALMKILLIRGDFLGVIQINDYFLNY